MARPKKIGLDYFPLDVSFNEQVQALESIHGNDGIVWLLKFWQAAYKTEFGEVNLRGLFGDISANNSRTTPEQQRKIISDCIELGLIIKISEGVYSSNGIKKRISMVSSDREKSLIRRKNELFGEQSPNNATKERKGKERKGKERKVNIKNIALFADATTAERLDIPKAPIPESQIDYEKRITDFQSKINPAEWYQAYPNVDVAAETKRACLWLKANPNKRKKFLNKFLVNWFNRTQENSKVTYQKNLKTAMSSVDSGMYGDLT